MSRVGRTVIKVPSGVTVLFTDSGFNDGEVTVSAGDKILKQKIKKPITVKVENGEVLVERGNNLALSRSLHGLYNRLIQNMITGVTKGFTRYLILNGVGYKALLKGTDLTLNLGYSHPIDVKGEEGVRFKVLTPVEISELNLGKEGVGAVVSISGIDKEKVGAMASKIRDLRPVEPYHMYGIRYSGERVRRKESKSGTKSGSK
jgi:large subunit ribosomal protein L6